MMWMMTVDVEKEAIRIDVREKVGRISACRSHDDRTRRSQLYMWYVLPDPCKCCVIFFCFCCGFDVVANRRTISIKGNSVPTAVNKRYEIRHRITKASIINTLSVRKYRGGLWAC